MNKQYWGDLVYEGEVLTEAAEGVARDLSEEIEPAEAGRSQTRRAAERYRFKVNDRRHRDPDRAEHRLQDVIDAYRWNHPEASDAVPRGVGRTRPRR